MTQLGDTINTSEEGNFSSQPVSNFMDEYGLGSSQEKNIYHEEVNETMTLLNEMVGETKSVDDNSDVGELMTNPIGLEIEVVIEEQETSMHTSFPREEESILHEEECIVYGCIAGMKRVISISASTGRLDDFCAPQDLWHFKHLLTLQLLIRTSNRYSIFFTFLNTSHIGATLLLPVPPFNQLIVTEGKMTKEEALENMVLILMAQLWQLAQRTTALPLGHGAFTTATTSTLLTEVNLDPNLRNILELKSWPEFHNAVAAGLRLAPIQCDTHGLRRKATEVWKKFLNLASDTQGKLSMTWIIYNKEKPNVIHAGLLLALGLHGHLRVLTITDIYKYYSQEHESTTVGLMLGLAASYRGIMQPAISKVNAFSCWTSVALFFYAFTISTVDD
ncbi:hypothetical protein RHMOL_Rhmol10G0121600 [Rhododendron molle]|uniref:Uncharacterized protein n=1 Tax=Rhododendron molle TaxID=49168 RepID=A0ACC0M1M8_RHOML|nr:hypothetical protein RHMOL_Rhmol10G0121600 [Rhododendron molle]